MRLTLIALLFCACRQPAPPAKAPAAERTTLDGLVSITLREDAASALGLKVVPVERRTMAVTLTVGGEVIVPAGRELVLAAPVGGRITGVTPMPGAHVKAGQRLFGLVPLAPVDRDVRARAERDVEAAKADVTLAASRLARAETMMNERSGSVRAFEDARAAKQIAEATLASSEARVKTLGAGALDADVSIQVQSPADGVLRTVRVATGQSVPAGAPLVEIASEGRWVRVALSAGDAARRAADRPALATRSGTGESVVLSPLDGPPSSDSLRGTLDVFYALPATWSPGERVVVQLETGRAHEANVIPTASVLRDPEGGAWVYVQQGPLQFRRQRVELGSQLDGMVAVQRGWSAETKVVVEGAVELWGFELGADR